MTGAEVLMIGSGILGAVQTFQQMNTQAAFADYNAAVARNNSIAARQQTDFEVARLREEKLRFLGTQRAAAAKAGGDVNTGSSLLLQLDTAQEFAIDALAVRHAGSVEEARFLAEAAIAKAEAKALRGAAPFAAGRTLLTQLPSNPSFLQGGSVGASAAPVGRIGPERGVQ